MLHVSDLIHYKKCPRFCWNCQNNPLPYESFYHMDSPFTALWQKRLGVEKAVSGEVGDTNEKTLKLLEENDVLLAGRFSYRECRTRIPLLMRTDQGYKAIYPLLSAYPKEFEAVKMKVNQMICRSVGIDIVKHEILYINKDYVRHGELDLDECLIITDRFFNRKNHPGRNIDEVIEELEIDLDTWIDQTNQVLSLPSVETIRSKTCTTGRRCNYYDICFDDSHLPDDSPVFLTTSQHKLEALETGIEHICEMDLDQIDGYKLQYSQYMASKQGKFVDHIALKHWLSRIEYPISYLDFEWDTFAFPPYDKMKPFDVLCFQYSLHVEDGDLKHYDYFGTGDCRKEFIQSLLKQIPKTGTVLVYNMEGAEKLRLVQLAEQFPRYKKQLMQICGRMVDLSKPFETGIYYANKMRGHYSLKNVLPVFTNQVSYQELEIHNGLNAVQAYRTFDTVSDEQKNEVRNNIRDYCKMDTYAEYVVYHGLLKESEGKDA